MNSNHTQPPSPKAIRGVERDKGRAKIEKWFHDEKRQEGMSTLPFQSTLQYWEVNNQGLDELPILSYIAQNVNLNAGGGDTAQGMASELLRSLLTRLGIDYHHDAQTLKDRAKEFSKKPGYNQRYHNMGVIQYFQHAAEFILFGTVWDPSFPAAVHLTGNTILSVEKDVIDGLTGDAAKKFATEVTAAKGGRPHVKLWKYVLYVLKPTWAAKVSGTLYHPSLFALHFVIVTRSRETGYIFFHNADGRAVFFLGPSTHHGSRVQSSRPG